MYTIELATTADSDLVGAMIYQMECELWGDESAGLCLTTFKETCAALLEDNRYWVFKAVDENKGVIGVLTIAQTSAIFAGGHFGEIMEIYIVPHMRSGGIGAALIGHAIAFSKAKGWNVLAVGAPSQPTWGKTLAFYKRCGFTEIGPKLEMSL